MPKMLVMALVMSPETKLAQAASAPTPAKKKKPSSISKVKNKII
jgi:hypothetical protein